jgi:RimJ/RimL family protein N-acetyltransferase
MLQAGPTCARLLFRLLAAEDLTLLHALALDEHVRRFLLDGERVSEFWCAQLIEASRREFADNKLGMWLLFERAAPAIAIGFAGFWRLDGVGAAPQLLYALKPAYTGRGYAAEAARALIEFARAQGALRAIDASVDEPNVASIAVLKRLGFHCVGEAPGAFGRMLLFRLPG